VEGSLHEIEIISNKTKDEGKDVYAVGYIFIRDGTDFEEIKKALNVMQIGGERKYGFGRVKAVRCPQVEEGEKIFGIYEALREGDTPKIKGSPIPFHLEASSKEVQFDQNNSEIEFIANRCTNPSEIGRYGMSFTQAKAFWAPGSIVKDVSVWIPIQKIFQL